MSQQVDCDTNGTTILYATHIFSGLDDWWTHIAFVHDGQVKIYGQYVISLHLPLSISS
jgi:ABC-type uncharacterized transport system ATPase subunit